MSCAVMRTRSPARSTVPSTIASTPNSRAISGRGLRAPLYCMADVRETTRSSPILARVVISASVSPSAKYSRFAPDPIPLAPGGRSWLDGSGFRLQPVYPEEADLLFIGRHSVRRVDPASSVRWRRCRKRRTSSHDLHDNDYGHVGINTALRYRDAHGSVKGV